MKSQKVSKTKCCEVILVVVLFIMTLLVIPQP